MMLKKLWSGLLRQMRLLAVLSGVAIAGGAAWSYLNDTLSDDAVGTLAQSDAKTDAQASAWGNQVLEEIHKHVAAGIPIRVANACGLGASSCFKCHNGNRAEKPGEDPEQDPWHVHHQKVNNSCAGCHQGNPRLMKESIAHRGLVANPASKPESTCFSCHGSDETNLVDVYRKLTDATGE
ncbi:MAG: hypothetical protein CMN57_02470 [Gammaproteobacteria bacterium]|nr:hypothetical protein [Gammaproteobacteria bacterium]